MLSFKARLFISHHRGNKSGDYFIQELLPHLEDKFLVLIDERIAVGDNWDKVINRYLSECHIAIIFLTADSVNSDEVLREITILSNRSDETGSPELIPLVLAGTSLEDVVKKLQVTRVNKVQFLDLRTAREPIERVKDALFRWLTRRVRRRRRAAIACTAVGALILGLTATALVTSGLGYKICIAALHQQIQPCQVVGIIE